MAKNMLGWLPHLTKQDHKQDLDNITYALALTRPDFRALPREEIISKHIDKLGLLCRKEVIAALRVYGTAAALATAQKLESKPRCELGA
jgi:hypothetical protein